MHELFFLLRLHFPCNVLIFFLPNCSEFEHNERDRYTRLQAQAHSQKSILVSLLMAAVSETSSDPQSDAQSPGFTPSRSTDIPDTRSRGFLLAQSPESPSSQQISFIAKG